MKKEDIPAISATNFDQAQKFVHQYDLGQWRVSEYIKALAELPKKDQGKYATDFNIARFIDEKRTKQSARGVMKKLVRLGLARELHETESGGFAYDITDKGGQAYTRLQQVERNWFAMWQSQIEPPVTDYSGTIRRLNGELKRVREQLSDTITIQKRLIDSQDSEIERLKAEVERLKKLAGEGTKQDTVPFPL